jgi:hypothetical protein
MRLATLYTGLTYGLMFFNDDRLLFVVPDFRWTEYIVSSSLIPAGWNVATKIGCVSPAVSSREL